ncbi:MAG TPA: TlpA disulfide reductase family protein, partial [Polyangia bacterium]
MACALFLLSACATAGGAGGGGGGEAASGNQVGAPVPEIKVDSLGGKKIDVASYRGRVLLLDVWASWCGPCKQELPMLDAMARRLKAQGIDVLAVSVDQERANVDKFLKG